jgi:hypothetical protein
MAHTYLFTAEFEDGTIIQQTQEDKSSIDPTKAKFLDVQEYEKKSPLTYFTLVVDHQEFEELPQVQVCSVDLTTGAFNINGAWFYTHRFDRSDIENYKDFRIIYLRNNTIHIHSETAEQIHLVGYTLGWQVTSDGENIQRIIKIGY